MRRLLVAALLSVAAPSLVIAAEGNKFDITTLEKAACANDAMRLCSHTYPDQDQLLDCLRSNVNSLSLVCSATFKAGLRRRHIPL